MHRLTRILVLSLLAAPLSVVHAGAAEPPPGIIPGTAGRDLPAPDGETFQERWRRRRLRQRGA